MRIPTYNLVDIPLFDGTIDDAVTICIQSCAEPAPSNKNFCISLTGAHGIVYARKDPDFRKLLQAFYINLPDGMPGVWASRIKGAKKMERCYGPDFFATFMKASAATPVKHYLCGGKEGVAGRLKQNCEEKFGNKNIVGTHCPPFEPVEDFDYPAIAGDINRSGADIVWVGLSTPKQEQFATRLAEYTDVHFLITVGAAFDFHIDIVRQAPQLVQKMGLEWFFRLLMEPKRLYKRYMEIVPLFLYYCALDLMKTKQQK